VDRSLPITAPARGAAPAHGLLDAVDEALLVVDADGRVTAANAHYLRLTGIAGEDLLGTSPPWPGWEPAGVSRIRRLLAEAPRAPRHVETSLAAADGTRLPVRVVWARLPAGDDGRAGHLLTVRRDAVPGAAPAGAADAHWEADLAAGTLEVSAGAAAMLGRSPVPRTLPLREAARLIGPGGLRGLRTAMAAPAPGSPPRHAVVLPIRPPGAAGALLARVAVAARAADGTATRLRGDLTPLAPGGLGESPGLEAVLEAVGVGVVVQEAGGAITRCNQAACEILGLTRGQLLGRDSYDARWRAVTADGAPFRGEDHPAMRTLATGRPVEGVLMGVDSPAHRERRWIRIGTAPLGTVAPGGPARAVVATFTDVTDAHLAAAAARRERDLSSGVMRAAGEGMLILEPGGTLVALNDAFRELTGFGLGDLATPRPPFPWWPPEETASIREGLAHLLAGRTGTVALTIMARDGRRIRVEAEWSHVRDDQGRIAAHIVTFHDLTDRLHAEAAVRRGDERFRAVLEAMAEGVLLVEPDGRLLMCNRAATEILGLDEGSLRALATGTGALRLVDETGAPLCGDGCPPTRALLEGGGYTNAVVGVDRPGRPRQWLLVSCRPTGPADAGEGHQASVVTFTDVGERHEAEERLRASEERFRLLFESQGDAVLLLDADGNVLEASPSAASLFGYAHDALPPLGPGIIEPDDLRRVRDVHRRVMAGESGLVTHVRVRRADGRRIWAEGVAGPVRDADGRPTAVQVSMRDVTERVLRAQDERALHRVAELVAAGAPAADIMAALAREVGGAVEADVLAVVRFEDERGHIEGYWRRGDLPDRLPVAEEIDLRGRETAAGMVRHTGGFVVVENPLPGDGTSLAGRIPRPRRAFGAPIPLGGTLWGCLSAAVLDERRIDDAAERLTRFAELAALSVGAIAERARLEHDAAVDPLTGLANRRVFAARLRSEISRSRRHGRRLSLVMIDLDHFKRVNDTLGHPEGDRVLREVAARIAAVARMDDTVARLGGEELAWILPETGAEAAFQAAERLRAAIGGAGDGDLGGITASMGVAELTPGAEADDLYRRADEALYWAKGHGRDRVAVYSPAMARELRERRPPDR
jgi:diguanylate cyclase (GGDEF)-like protein/PAS domain S-box-containing protein